MLTMLTVKVHIQDVSTIYVFVVNDLLYEKRKIKEMKIKKTKKLS